MAALSAFINGAGMRATHHRQLAHPGGRHAEGARPASTFAEAERRAGRLRDLRRRAAGDHSPSISAGFKAAASVSLLSIVTAPHEIVQVERSSVRQTRRRRRTVSQSAGTCATVFRAMRRARFRRSDRTQKSLPMFPGRLKASRTTTNAMEPPRCSPQIELAEGKDLADCPPQPGSGSSFSRRSTRKRRLTSTCTSSSTATRRTNIEGEKLAQAARGFPSISLRRAVRG